MTFQNEIIATQRHDMDLATSARRIAVTRPRTSVSNRLGHVLIEAGSRLVSDRRTAARLG